MRTEIPAELHPGNDLLDVEIDEDVRERAKEGHRWCNPIWRLKDGSFAEW